MRRTNNQDNMTVSLATSMEAWESKGHLFVVADGMGAHAAGELASKLAVDHIPHLYARFNDMSAPEALKKAVNGANAEIHRRGQANEDFHHMGTTCSTLTLLPQGAVVAHIGDSRIYRLRKNRLEQMTFDHSLVWEMKAAGQLTAEEEASGKIPKNVITRSLGPYPECKVDLEGPFKLEVGDTFMMCSDGLTGVVRDSELGAIMAIMPPDEAVKVLVDLANLRGGPDNITLIIVRVLSPEMSTNGKVKTIKVNTQKGKYAVHPMVWAICIITALLAVAFYFASGEGGWMNALLPGVAAGISGLYIVVRLLMATLAGDVVTEGRVFGKAPYTRTTCATGAQISKQLADVLKQLQMGAVEKDWKVDWKKLKAMIEEAELAFSKNDHSTAARTYGKSICFLMDQLRNQNDGASSSSVDL